MKQFTIALVTVALAAFLSYALIQQTPAKKEIFFFAGLMPDDALLYIQAQDLGRYLAEWDRSPQKQAWLNSQSYAQFQNSKLALKLQSRFTEFERVAGFGINLPNVETVVGGRSALALYDIGNLEFVFITDITPAKASASQIIKAKPQFEERKRERFVYYVKRSESGDRTVAFAQAGQLLIVATREELIHRALVNYYTSEKGGRLSEASGFQRAAQLVASAHDVTLYLDQAKINKTPYFKNEWVHRNFEVTSQIDVGMIDLELAPKYFRENRYFIGPKLERAEPERAGSSGDRAFTNLIEGFFPEGSEYMVAEQHADPHRVAERLINVFVNKLPAPFHTVSYPAPFANAYAGYEAARTKTTYEQQIDEPPVPLEKSVAERVNTQTDPVRDLETLLSAAGVRAVMASDRPEFGKDGLFVHFSRAAIVDLGDSSKFELPRFRNVIERHFATLHSVVRLGTRWEKGVVSGIGYETLLSPSPISFCLVDRYLVIADSPNYLKEILNSYKTRAGRRRFVFLKSDGRLVRYGGVVLVDARKNFDLLMPLLDSQSSDSERAHEPLFFSENISSLLRVLSPVERVIVQEIDHGRYRQQEVMYRLTGAR
jgi:hypothetical protein